MNVINAELATFAVKEKSKQMIDRAAREQLVKRKEALENKLKRLQSNTVHSRNYRLSQKRKFESFGEENRLRGRPRIEDQQKGLLDAIVDIASAGASAHVRRRAETINTPQTVDELHQALAGRGFKLSRTSTYRRLVPRRLNSNEGKRHVNFAPVKPMKAQNDEHSKHQDEIFCKLTIDSVNFVVSMLGPDEVLYMSVDEKAKVLLGVIAAKKQTSIIVTLAHPLKTPDHDFPVGSRHSLIPSVTAILEIKKDCSKAVTYKGPLQICIRSARHCSTTADTHSKDYKQLMKNSKFTEFVKIDGKIKPVHIRNVDGGPDQSPRNLKVLLHGTSSFNSV